MNKINIPEITFKQSLDACIESIRDEDLKNRLRDIVEKLENESDQYKMKGETGLLNTIERNYLATEYCMITEDDFIKLYSYYFVQKSPGREIYDKLLSSAEGKCPYCGGIGHTANLDHYLPKKQFVKFSVLPINLIPSCRDCNMGQKGTIFSDIQNEQIIHPYLDLNHFFNDQWIFAEYSPSTSDEIGFVRFYTNPPSQWNDVDKDRVKIHFTTFDLSKKYTIEAARELVTFERQKNLLNLDDLQSVIIEPIIATYPINHWKRVMYTGILKSIRNS